MNESSTQWAPVIYELIGISIFSEAGWAYEETIFTSG